MAEGAELRRLRGLFAACDARGCGRIERDDFAALCAELRVRPTEAEAVFQRLDSDRDGAVTFPEFVRAFRGAAQRQHSQHHRPRPRRSLSPAAAEPDAELELGQGQGLEPDLELDLHLDLEQEQERAWRDFQLRLGDEARYIPRCSHCPRVSLLLFSSFQNAFFSSAAVRKT